MSEPLTPTRHGPAGQAAEPGMAGTLKREGAELLGAAREGAGHLAEEGVAAGAERAGGLARAVHRAAEAIEPESPTLARTVREAARGLDGMARRLRERGPGEMLRGAEDLARRQPMLVLGAAALAGFALARFTKSSGARRGMGEARGEMPRHDTPMGTTIEARQAAHHAGDMPPGGPARVRDAGDMPRPATLSGAPLGGAAAQASRGAGDA
jgi:hypothetical protein